LAEVIQLDGEWHARAAAGDDLCNLRIMLLSKVYEEAVKALFGPVDSQKVSELTRSGWVWALIKQFCKFETSDKACQLIERLSFSLEESEDDGDNDATEDQLKDLVEDEGEQEFLCTKEEVAKREAFLVAAEAIDEEYHLPAERGDPEGVAFTNEELIGNLQALLQANAHSAAAAAAIAAAEIVRPPESETEAGAGTPAAAAVLDNDGPDALDIGGTHPSNQIISINVPLEGEKEQQEARPQRNSEPAPAAKATAAADGPHELQLSAPQPHAQSLDDTGPSSNKKVDDHHINGNLVPSQAAAAAAAVVPERGIGWMAGGWAPAPGGPPAVSLPESETAPEAIAPINMGTIPPSADQNTPSAMFKNNKDAATPGEGVPATAAPPGGEAEAAGLGQGSVVPETQPEQLQHQQQCQTEGMDSAVRPAAPGGRLIIPAAGTETDAGGTGSQPVGSQEVKNTLNNLGILVDEIEGASQQEVEVGGSALKLFNKNGAASGGGGGGDGGFAVPAPRQSSRLGPKGANVSNLAKELKEKPQQPQQQRRRVSVSKREANAERRRAHLDKVMVKNRPDLGLGEKLIVVKGAASVVPTRKQPERQQKFQKQHQQQQQQEKQHQQQRTPVEEVAAPAVGRSKRRKVLLSGLHDTEDCYEMDGTDSTAAGTGGAGDRAPAIAATTATKTAANEVEEDSKVNNLQSRVSPRRLSGVLAAIADHEKKRAGTISPRGGGGGGGGGARVKRSLAQPPPETATEGAVAALESMAAKKARVAAVVENDDQSEDPFQFPPDIHPAGKSPAPLPSPSRKSPRRPSPTEKAKAAAAPARPAAAAAAAAVPRQPYQPGPIKVNVDGLIITRLPHPIIQTAPEYSSMEISITAGLAEVQQTTQNQAIASRRISPRKRKQDTIEEKEEKTAVGAGGTSVDGARPSGKRQRLDENNEEGGRCSGRRQTAVTTPEPADSEDETIKERWLSTAVKRKQSASKATPSKKAVEEEAGMSSPRPKRAAREVAETKLQQSRRRSGGGSGSTGVSKPRLSPPPPGVTYGCSKCRYTSKGCSTCRAKASKSNDSTDAVAAPAAPMARRRLSALPPSVSAQPAAKAKQPASTLPIPVVKQSTIVTTTAGGAGPLQGMCFLVSGSSGEGSEAKGAIEELIISLGGRVLSDIPAPPPHGATLAGNSTLNRRLSVDLRSPLPLPQIDAVITDRNARKAKCIYAAIKGLPVISPDWLKVCKKTKKRAPWTAKYQLLAEVSPSPAPVFAGLRVHLKVAGTKSLGKSIAQLMQHAGAQMTSAPKESSKDYEASCDLVIIGRYQEKFQLGAGFFFIFSSIYFLTCFSFSISLPDDDVSAKDRNTLERLARRLRIPCHNRDWAIRAMLEGALPDDFAPPNSKQKPTAAGRKRPALAAAGAEPSSPAVEPQEAEDLDIAMGDQDNIPEPSPSVEFGRDQAEEAEQPGRRATTATGGVAAETSTAAAARRSRRNNAGANVQEVPVPPAQRRMKSSPQVVAPTAAPALATASPEPNSFTWIGEPISPPQGSTPAGRRYYRAVMFNNQRIQVGSHVELSSMPGESAPRVAQVAALWAERDINGHDKPFGRFLRLLRPDDTSLALAFLHSQKKQVFMSTVEEPRLSLRGVERRCVVAFPSCADELTSATQEVNGQEAADYVCMAQYDLQDGVLKPLPQQ
jgi:hypothetical protein